MTDEYEDADTIIELVRNIASRSDFRQKRVKYWEDWAEATIERITHALAEKNRGPGGQHVGRPDPWTLVPHSVLVEWRRDLCHMLGRAAP